MRTNHRAGQSLIEVVVAVGVVVALALSLVTATLETQKAARSAQSSTQASELIQQSFERVRELRNRRGFAAVVTGQCLILQSTAPDPANWQLTACGGTGGETVVLNKTSFTRKIAITAPSSNKRQVVVSVSWQDSGGLQTVASTTFLTDWANAEGDNEGDDD